jgi:hypothetical protein
VSQGFRGCVHGNGPAWFVVPGLVPGIHDLSKAIVGCGSRTHESMAIGPRQCERPSFACFASYRGLEPAEARSAKGGSEAIHRPRRRCV